MSTEQPAHEHEPPEGEGMWIRSHPDEKGRYHLVLELDMDDAIPLTAASAYGWAREVLSAVAAAEYDAAIIRQMTALGMKPHDAAVVVSQVRSDRAAEIPLSLTPGLNMTPGVSLATGNGFITLSRHGKPIGQWDMGDAREHVLNLLTAVEVANLDSAYLRALIGFGLDRGRGEQVIDDLGKYREVPR